MKRGGPTGPPRFNDLRVDNTTVKHGTFAAGQTQAPCGSPSAHSATTANAPIVDAPACSSWNVSSKSCGPLIPSSSAPKTKLSPALSATPRIRKWNGTAP